MSTASITWLDGYAPVQAEGFTHDGRAFYFRARGNRWSFTVGSYDETIDPWSREEAYGDEPYVASWMEHDVARSLILRCLQEYESEISS